MILRQAPQVVDIQVLVAKVAALVDICTYIMFSMSEQFDDRGV
jgi:hypothetical protein